MKWLLISGGILVALILVVILIGWLLPVKHTVTVTARINARPDRIWQRLVDFRHYPDWRRSLRSVEAVSDTSWVETDNSSQRLSYSMEALEPLRRLETRLTDTTLPFGGRWILALDPAGDVTTVTITEHGEVYNPFFRFVSRFIIGHQATLNRYAAELTASFK